MIKIIVYPMQKTKHFRVYNKNHTQNTTPILVIEAKDYLEAISIIATKHNINPATIHIIEAERDNKLNQSIIK